MFVCKLRSLFRMRVLLFGAFVNSSQCITGSEEWVLSVILLFEYFRIDLLMNERHNRASSDVDQKRSFDVNFDQVTSKERRRIGTVLVIVHSNTRFHSGSKISWMQRRVRFPDSLFFHMNIGRGPRPQTLIGHHLHTSEPQWKALLNPKP